MQRKAVVMIENGNNPVQWAMLLYELDDAREHLGKLVEQMAAIDRIDEEDFRIQLGHVYSHLNRAWNGRNNVKDVDRELWKVQSQFPADLEPV